MNDDHSMNKVVFLLAILGLGFFFFRTPRPAVELPKDPAFIQQAVSYTHLLARGLTNYSAAEVRQIRGCKSPRIAEILGHCPYEEVIHYDNMALVGNRPT